MWSSDRGSGPEIRALWRSARGKPSFSHAVAAPAMRPIGRTPRRAAAVSSVGDLSRARWHQARSDRPRSGIGEARAEVAPPRRSRHRQERVERARRSLLSEWRSQARQNGKDDLAHPSTRPDSRIGSQARIRFRHRRRDGPMTDADNEVSVGPTRPIRNLGRTRPADPGPGAECEAKRAPDRVVEGHCRCAKPDRGHPDPERGAHKGPEAEC